MVSMEYLQSVCTGRIGIDEPLARMTTFRIGGKADIYVEPMNAEEVRAIVAHFRASEMPYIVLGNGSNVLIHDDGYRGACISLEAGFSFVEKRGDTVEAGAGVRLATFVDFCIGHGYAGTEMLAGIPGTLGGAVIMNAGAYGGEISDHLIDVTVLRGAEVVTLAKEECGFEYRNSSVRNDIVLSARFHFPPGDVEAMKARRKELLIKRNAAQPTRFPNAGSIFKNPKDMFAAKLIEDCGLKEYRIGGAEVSPQHANFVINNSDASSSDILAVINHVRQTVFRERGIALELEVLLIGFPDDAIIPLTSTSKNENS